MTTVPGENCLDLKRKFGEATDESRIELTVMTMKEMKCQD
jgi:hypothetical protein